MTNAVIVCYSIGLAVLLFLSHNTDKQQGMEIAVAAWLTTLLLGTILP